MRRRGVAVVSSLALVVAACAGGDGDPVETIAASAPADDEAAPDPALRDPASETAAPETDSGEPPPDAGPAAEASDEASAEQDPGEEASTPPTPAGPNDLPAVVVRDIATGDDVDLSALAPGELPFVVWFWAPH